MQYRSRFVVINGRELRLRRLALGWTQRRLAKVAGYTERLIRKAESGGSLDIETIQNLAEALSTKETILPAESLMVDNVAIARKWVESFERLEAGMLEEIGHYLAPEFEFICPGDPVTAPFIGTWKGPAGLQQWLDLYFGLFQRHPAENVEYFIGENTVIARWLESGTLQGVSCAKVRINMHFQFENGLIRRIEDDYDTWTGASLVSNARRC